MPTTKTASPFTTYDVELRELHELLDQAIGAAEKLRSVLPPRPARLEPVR